MIDLSRSVIVIGSDAPEAIHTAASVLAGEVEARTGIRWPAAERATPGRPAISLSLVPDAADVPGPEGYHLSAAATGPSAVRIVARDGRGILYGAGCLLRKMHWARGTIAVPGALDIATAPAQQLRGHQLGYRPLPNTYDAWRPEQFEQYIRELAIFGANAIETIPVVTEEAKSTNALMVMPREEMDRRISGTCARYDMEFWAFAPALVDLADDAARARLLAANEAFYRTAPRIDAVFVPGGDPGNNHPRLLLPFLRELDALLKRYHPRAGVWFSLQKFEPDKAAWTYEYLSAEQPDWIAGIVSGPWDPGIDELRRRLPARYPIRAYPDLTHNVRSQFPVLWWDPALAFTLGREAPNPRPIDEAIIHAAYTHGTIGALAYSEGIHDDVNKIVWTMRGWDPDAAPRDILIDYARFFFGPDVAERAADGILALERNWQGPLATNGAVEATLAHWRGLERERPELAGNWRWQLCLLRAYYDAYVRSRLICEAALEEEANRALASAPARGPEAAMDEALAILSRAETEPIRPDLHARVVALCDEMFRAIGYQTSVEKYGAEGLERGAILDFLDYPLNNRRWLEDQFGKVRALPSREEQLARLETIRTWEHPGPGGTYDDVGNVAKSPHVVRGEGLTTDPYQERSASPTFMWWESGRSRVRQSWLTDIHWPILRYDGLDPTASYVLRMTGYRDLRPRVNGERVEPSRYDREIGTFKEYPVPGRLTAGGVITVTFDDPDVGNIHWREWSRVNEVWLLRR